MKLNGIGFKISVFDFFYLSSLALPRVHHEEVDDLDSVFFGGFTFNIIFEIVKIIKI